MTKRENAMAILNGQQPDYYFDFMDAVAFIPDPVFMSGVIPQDGLPYKDAWGVTFVWHPDSPGKHPVDTDDTVVIKDIEKWRDYVVVPDPADYDWSAAAKAASEIDRKEMFVGLFSAGGLFERSHHLMGLQEGLISYMTNPDEVAELLRVIADHKIKLLQTAAKHAQPDIVFFHDDWGTKTNLFLPPDLWRKLIKPLHAEIVQAAHECNIIFIHHADCICQPIVEDMAEIGIDIWQGIIAQNDIAEIQRVLDGKMALIGGIDGPKIDVESNTEEEIRAEVRRVIDSFCPAGKFFPSIPHGRCFREWNHNIYRDELEKYGREWAQRNPVGKK